MIIFNYDPSIIINIIHTFNILSIYDELVVNSYIDESYYQLSNKIYSVVIVVVIIVVIIVFNELLLQVYYTIYYTYNSNYFKLGCNITNIINYKS